MSPTRSKYSKLGLKLVSLEDNLSRTPKKPSMAEEKKNDGADDPINLLLEQALTRQRDEMMENFSHILQRLPIAIRCIFIKWPLWRHLTFQGTS
jgi:hypothetical protein